jgi:hypothetical protein
MVPESSSKGLLSMSRVMLLPLSAAVLAVLLMIAYAPFGS